MKKIKIKLGAKTDVGLERTNNEDNFQVAQDLSESSMQWVNDKTISLGEKGCLLVVADGMGGMNAGEIASAIAIDVVRNHFSPDRISEEVLKSRFGIEKFMKTAIQQADAEIKKKGRENSQLRGMGTTIVIGWLYDGVLYVSWCGDSRAYIYNPVNGLHQISKDHSYVQTLVDKGVISAADAFDYPDSNIITRSLSDTGPKAIPDCLVKPIDVCNDDIILLCSDGLSGMIRDAEIEAIMSKHTNSMSACVNALIDGAIKAAGADNVTIALCQIVSGAPIASSNRVLRTPSIKFGDSNKFATCSIRDSIKKHWLGISCLFVALFIGIAWYSLFRPSIQTQVPEQNEVVIIEDTMPVNHTPKKDEFKTTDDDKQIELDIKIDEPSTSIKNPLNVHIGKAKEETSPTGKDDSELDITPIELEAPEDKISEDSEPPHNIVANYQRKNLYEYRIQPSDTWESLAKRHKVPVEELRAVNKHITGLIPGNVIYIPKSI